MGGWPLAAWPNASLPLAVPSHKPSPRPPHPLPPFRRPVSGSPWRISGNSLCPPGVPAFSAMPDTHRNPLENLRESPTPPWWESPPSPRCPEPRAGGSESAGKGQCRRRPAGAGRRSVGAHSMHSMQGRTVQHAARPRGRWKCWRLGLGPARGWAVRAYALHTVQGAEARCPMLCAAARRLRHATVPCCAGRL